MTEENQKTSKEELIGYHKGALNTLIAERSELVRIVGVTEALIQVHIKELDKLGIKLQVSKSDSSQSK
ncbi:MAG: hypothetical protein AABX66_03560 [Nanoarchaeota archaeon]